MNLPYRMGVDLYAGHQEVYSRREIFRRIYIEFLKEYCEYEKENELMNQCFNLMKIVYSVSDDMNSFYELYDAIKKHFK